MKGNKICIITSLPLQIDTLLVKEQTSLSLKELRKVSYSRNHKFS